MASGPWVRRWKVGPGFKDRVRLLRILGELGARQWPVRRFAIQALRSPRLPDSRDRERSAVAALDHARRNLSWTREIDEVFVQPDHTLEAGGGDCDDLAMLLYAMLRNLGFSTPEVEFAFLRDGANWTHVWPRVWLPRPRRWFHLEPSLNTVPPGTSPLAAARARRRIV